jgi:hypothetical protein
VMKTVVLRGFLCLVILMVLEPRLCAQGTTDYVQRALEDTTFVWRSLETRGVTIYYRKDSFAERHRMMILRSVTSAVDEVAAFLDEPGYGEPLSVFYLGSREEMERIVGRPYSGFADWTAHGVFVVLNPGWRSFEKHEIAHVITMGVWGSPHDTSGWMIEGIAVSCDGWCREYTVDEVALHLLSAGRLPPLKEFVASHRSLGEIAGGIYAASVAAFIKDAYGAKALRRLWMTGCQDVSKLLGADLDEVEAAWKDYLGSAVRKDIQVDLRAIEERGCG